MPGLVEAGHGRYGEVEGPFAATGRISPMAAALAAGGDDLLVRKSGAYGLESAGQERLPRRRRKEGRKDPETGRRLGSHRSAADLWTIHAIGGVDGGRALAEAEKRSSSEDVFSSPRMLHGGDGTERFATSTSDGGRIKCKGGSRRDGGANVGGGKSGKGGKGGNGATSESLTLFGLFWGGGDKREKSMKERKGREAAAGRVEQVSRGVVARQVRGRGRGERKEDADAAEGVWGAVECARARVCV